MKDSVLQSALDRVLEKYPDYSDGYAMRAGFLCSGSDRAAILSNINSALKYANNSRQGRKSLAWLLSIRAKIEYADGDVKAAMENLEKAIRANIDDAFGFANSGAVAPEKTASACTWTETDMNALIQNFPADYRAYLFRGLYYGFFVSFSKSNDLFKLAIEDLNKSAELNKDSALPLFFKAEVFSRNFLFKQGGMSDAQRESLNNEILDILNKTLILDPNLLPAISERAYSYFKLKQFKQAIIDYDKVLALDSKNPGAYNDRGLSEMQLGNTYASISDFSKAIENKKRELLQHSNSYEARAEAYMKTPLCQ